jgi:ribosome-associated protein
MTTPSTIKLDQFLKLSGLVSTGGHAKLLIQAGEVKVNGKVETQRGRKLVQGDRVSVFGETITVDFSKEGNSAN